MIILHIGFLVPIPHRGDPEIPPGFSNREYCCEDIMCLKNKLKKLIVFPGGGSPQNQLYSSVYALLEKGARSFGYHDVRLCTWPGQCAGDGKSLDFMSAVEAGKQMIIEIEDLGVPYDILGRSFGCIVAAKIAGYIPLKNLGRIVMWGPPPYSVLWDVFKKNFEAAQIKANSKGTILSQNFFDSITPIESLLPSINHSCVIATGTEDPYVPPTYLDYLQYLVSSRDNFAFREAEKCPHEVTEEMPEEVKSEYLAKIFN